MILSLHDRNFGTRTLEYKLTGILQLAKLATADRLQPVNIMRAQTIAKLIGVAILIFVIIITLSTSSYVVQPGERGIEVTLGKVSPMFKPEGFGFKTPFITTIVPVT